jgi:hypothetical protein
MASTTFTTWSAVYTAMLNKLASGDANVGSVGTGAKTITYKSNSEFLKMLEFVEGKANAETGAVVPRTYAKQGGRGV